jgi:hypothetical protein
VAATTAGSAPLNEILLRYRLQFFDAPAHSTLPHLLKSFVASHNHNDTAFGITFMFCILRATPSVGTTARQFEMYPARVPSLDG